MVAFPQGGVAISPGTLELLELAVREGAEAIGGLDPIGVDRDPKAQLDGIFAIAARHGCGVDIHLHDRGEMGALTIEMIADRTAALGLAGRVTISHAFCLGMLEPARLDVLVRRLVDHDIAVMTHAPAGATPFPPVRLLTERGVRLCTGSDGVRDAWSPLNTGDMLERAYLIAYRSGFRDDAGLELALRMATYRRCAGDGLRRLRSARSAHRPTWCWSRPRTPPKRWSLHPVRRCVLKRGRVVARDGRALIGPAEETLGAAPLSARAVAASGAAAAALGGPR